MSAPAKLGCVEKNKLHAANQAEEIQFFRSFGWTDRKVAERLGMTWNAYWRFVSRHPELGPIIDPEETERKRWAEFQRQIKKGISHA